MIKLHNLKKKVFIGLSVLLFNVPISYKAEAHTITPKDINTIEDIKLYRHLVNDLHMDAYKQLTSKTVAICSIIGLDIDSSYIRNTFKKNDFRNPDVSNIIRDCSKAIDNEYGRKRRIKFLIMEEAYGHILERKEDMESSCSDDNLETYNLGDDSIIECQVNILKFYRIYDENYNILKNFYDDYLNTPSE